MTDYALLIDGALVPGDLTLDVINPATEELLATAPRASEAQLNQAVAAAKRAFPAWGATPFADRVKAVAALADAIEANTDALARLLTQEQGKPLADAMGEVKGSIYFFRYFQQQTLPVETIDDARRHVEIHHRPLGVVGAIVPWNFPIMMLAFKLPAALIAGNTVVVKPAPTTPLTTLMIGALAKDILPAGVLNVIVDQNDLGSALTAHPDVRKISFTGSTATGRKVLASSSDSLKRVTLELGGNDAAIVLGDVDPKKVAAKLFRGAFANSGQVCVAIKRLYVHEDIHDALCAELERLADEAVVGDGLQQGTQYGPLQNRMQYERVKTLIEEARAGGATVTGGDVPEGPGFFIRPAIVRDVDENSRLVEEEQFGPVLPVMRFSDPEDALARANASPYGLGGSVWSDDADQAIGLAARFDSGTVWINKHTDLAADVPFAGAKQSGMGSELGEDGLLEFTQRHIINVAKTAPARV